ncbi:odorant receptor 13a-like [Microplitis mediator]|uniref:odorant receptor 13a-like n=1 Tax=Microplitis mediator TaxID=375433 RepID=UPI002555DE15|nr:odorant receptor 13a-like [Microplitis mediator]
MNTNVEKQFKEAKLLFDNIRWMIQILNAWPIDRTTRGLLLFIFYLIYENIYLSMAYNDFFSTFGDLQLMTANLLGTLIQTVMMTRLTFVRFSKSLEKIIIEVTDNFCDKNYQDPNEKRIYVQYSSLATKFYKITMIFGAGSAFGFGLLPLQKCIISWLLHKPVVLELPFKIKVFYHSNLSADQTILLYIYELPLPINACSFIASINLQFMIIMNICARTAILRNLIKNVNVKGGTSSQKLFFKQITLKHLVLLKLTDAFEQTWTPIFCFETIILVPLTSLVMFSVLALDGGETVAILTLVTYVGSMTSCLFANCWMGQLLLDERDQLMEAFYLCEWYEMSNECKKFLLICMINCANIPMQITAGKIYIFSFNGFTGIMKSSLGYVSLLRTLTL